MHAHIDKHMCVVYIQKQYQEPYLWMNVGAWMVTTGTEMAKNQIAILKLGPARNHVPSALSTP
jgi:hypothetical protein